MTWKVNGGMTETFTKKNSYFARWTPKMNPTAQAFSAAAFGTKDTESSWFTSLKFSSRYPRISRLWACAEIASKVSSSLPLGVRQDIPALKDLSYERSFHSSQPWNPLLWRSTGCLSQSSLYPGRAKDTQQAATGASCSPAFWLLLVYRPFPSSCPR